MGKGVPSSSILYWHLNFFSTVALKSAKLGNGVKGYAKKLPPYAASLYSFALAATVYFFWDTDLGIAYFSLTFNCTAFLNKSQ